MSLSARAREALRHLPEDVRQEVAAILMTTMDRWNRVVSTWPELLERGTAVRVEDSMRKMEELELELSRP